MKKLLFCAGILALAASCTEDEFVSTSGQQQAAATEGITFTAMPNTASTRGEFVNVGGSYVPFWSSDPGEQGEDKISVFSYGTSDTDDWADAAATYKATKSQRRGEFTGNSEKDILQFANDGSINEENPARFLVIFPAGSYTLSGEDVNEKTVNVAFGASDGQINLAEQTQTNTKGAGIFSNNVMYSATTGFPHEGEYGETVAGVGENLNLNFQYALSGITFSFENVKDYADYLGNMTKITFESLGEPKGNDQYDANKAVKFIPAGTGAGLTVTATYDPDEKTMSAEGKINMGGSAEAEATVTMKDDDGLEWSDDAHAYLIVAPVTRNGKEESFQAIYKFANTSFSKVVESSKDWPAGMFTNFPALNIEDYDYFLTYEENETTGDKYTLVVNKNGLTNAIKNGKVEWDIDGDGEAKDNSTNKGINETPDVADIQKVVINGEMTDADWEALQDFEGIEELTLNDVTEIPADGFEGLEAATVKKLNLPKVTTIDPEFRGQANPEAFSALTDLNLASYQFPDKEINAVFFNDDVKSELVTLDISAVESMAPTFNVNRTLKFQGYEKLTTVKANTTKVVASQSAFEDCSKLESVTGVFDLSQAINAFMNAGTDPDGDAVLDTVNVANDIIPDNAFYGASNVKYILLNGQQVAPSSIGENGLAKTAIEYMDLSKAETLGKCALAYAENYKGVEKDNKLVVINAEVLEDCILQKTGVVNVQFNKATQLNGNVFANVETLSQVKFVEAFTIDQKDFSKFNWYQTFGTNVGNVELFVNPEQEYRNGKTLTFPYYAGGKVDESHDAATFTFNQIKEE